MPSSAASVLSRLRITALVAVIITLVQAGLGFAALSGTESVVGTHGVLGYLNFVVGLVAAFFGFQASRVDASLKGLFMHALSLPVLALVQIGIIEAAHGHGPLKWVHVVLGLAYLVAAIGLWTLAGKRADAAARTRV